MSKPKIWGKLGKSAPIILVVQAARFFRKLHVMAIPTPGNNR